MNTTVLAPSKVKDISNYPVLLGRVRETLIEGQKKIEEQKVLTYLQAGKHIHEHLFFYKDRADYGKDVIEKLSMDLDVSDTLLYQCLQGYRAFKNLYARTNSHPLPPTWAHLRAAMRVPDEKKRFNLMRQAVEGEWTSRELEIEVRNYHWKERVSQSDGQKPVALPPVILGPFHTYKIIRPETIHDDQRTLLLDLGFSMKKEMNNFPGVRYPSEIIVTSTHDSKGGYSVIKAEDATEDSLYTYKAYVMSVIDGDTLKLDFRLGFGDRKGETIRLNHIDCPEIDTPEGVAAKKFVEFQLSGCEFVTVKSVRTRKEKWGRYLGDVFFQKKGMNSPVYLNQLLLDKGHAVKVRS
ncbi:MAG: thermonuclease family protein [Candidatus Omnitrophica bacterium]|nr:thermonuclease family protein [Candidatus Omnitrophota bacterium]